MSVLGLAGNILSQFDALVARGNSHPANQAFAQFAYDLHSGNFPENENSLTSLAQPSSGLQNNSLVAFTPTTPSSDPLAIAVSHLAQHLHAHSRAVSQHAYSSLQQELQQLSATSSSISPSAAPAGFHISG